MVMLNPTKEETKKRYNLLPAGLKKALFDKRISEKIFQICGDFKIPPEEIKKLLKISGFVFLGFLTEKNLKKEISDNLDIPEQSSNNLSERLIREVFSDYKGLFAITQSKEELKNFQDILSSDGKSAMPLMNEIGLNPVRNGISNEEREKEAKNRREFLQKKGSDGYRESLDEREKTSKFLKVEPRPPKTL